MSNVDKFLEHYGVAGMKWGVRKARNEEARKEAFKAKSTDAKKATKIREKASSKGTDSVSNKDLQDAINRMNLEVNYSRLSEQTRKKSRGEKVANFLLKDVAEVEVKRVVKAQAAITVEKALESKGQAELAKRIKPKKK